MNRPVDQDQRDRFIHDLDRNFSVVASAGSGKTRAITERIVALAQEKPEWLPQLVVVTYTNRAADEMQQRARQALQAAKDTTPEVLAALGRAFFGTIHSFCLRLLREHGHHIGLPANLELAQDDEGLWRDFVQQHSSFGNALTPTQKRDLLRLVSAHELLELGRFVPADMQAETCGDFPAIAFEPVYQCTGRANAAANIQASKERLRAWEQLWRDADGFSPFPDPVTTSADFVTAWQSCMHPLRGWLRSAALAVALDVSRAYRCYRLARGFVTYDDQIALALSLLCHAEAGPLLRAQNHRVILDEAQDTDPSQFGVLLELTRAAEAKGDWLADGSHPPRPGHFSMVGDFQQSIFSKRADLAHYRRVHDRLVECGSAEALRFAVTFRLDTGIVDFVNCTFQHVLKEGTGQVSYQQLAARPGALPGQVLRLEVTVPDQASELGVNAKMAVEAEQIATWLKSAGLEKLRADCWGQVAIICPRKGWFGPLRTALRKTHLKSQVQSEQDVKGDSPAFAWLTALTVVLSQPENTFEIVGVLREIYGISDGALAEFSEGDGARFRLGIDAPGPIGRVLRELAELRARVLSKPLFAAVAEIVSATRLRDRLASLPADDFPDLGPEIESLLTRAAAEEANGATLRDFAESLQSDFHSVREVRGTDPDAVQLITGYKAKGSEWHAVIIPGFARPVTSQANRCPCAVRDPRDGSVLLALNSDDLAGELKTLLDARQRQEFERLLYVAITRAKHTLVLVDDLTLFAGKKGTSSAAQAALLHCARGATNAEVFATLPSSAKPCADTEETQKSAAKREATDAKVPELVHMGDAQITTAQARASAFVKRNPSALAEESDIPVPGIIVSAGGDNSPVYGLWWHSFVEFVDWSAGPASWDETFKHAQILSPDPVRSRDEWDRLRAQLGPATEWGSALCRGDLVIQAEMPFLWKMSPTECIEGIMDLVVFDPVAKEWLIADWKTNPITAVDLGTLQAHYLPQLAAYWRALSEMTGQRVRAALYSTACAAWMPYTPAELEQTWHRIAGDPQAISAALAEEQR